MSRQGRVLHDVLQEHLEELDFLWETRENSIFRWDFRPLHLRRLEARMEAHLDGLREGGDAGIELAKGSLAGETWSLVAAAAWTLLARPEPIFGAVREAVASAVSGASLGIRQALRHSDPVLWRETAERDISTASDPALAIWADALAFRRMAVPPATMKRLLESGEVMVRRIGYAVRFRIGPSLSASEVQLGVEDPDPNVREWVLRAAVRWGSQDILPMARHAAARGEDQDGEAVFTLGAWGEPSDLSILMDAIPKAPVATAALRGIGALGDARGIPVLLEALQRPELAEAAGEAFAALTGEPLGLVPVELDGERVEVPDSKEAAAFWEKARDRFVESGRYRGGRDMNQLSLPQILSDVDLEGARDAYLRDCLRSKGKAPDVELERFAGDLGTIIPR